MAGGFGSNYLGGGSSAPAAKSSGGFGANYASGPAAKPKSGGGGILGALGGASHWVAQKAGLAAHDLKSIPGGVIQQGKVTGNDIVALLEGAPMSDPRRQAANNLGNSIVKSGVESLKHPGRDPFQTALNVAALGHAGASGVARGAEVARTGSVSALARELPVKQRLLTKGDEQVPLHASRNPLIRAGQGVHDKVVQKAITERPDSRLAGYGTSRIAGSIAETSRYRQRSQETPANVLEAQGAKLKDKGAPPKSVRQAALRLASENSTAEEAARFHRDQAARGVNPKENMKQARIADAVGEHGLLTKDAKGDVVVDAVKFPKLASVDERVAQGQTQVDQIAAEYGMRSPEQLRARIDAPARIRAGASFLHPQEADAMLRDTESMLARVEKSSQEAADDLAASRRGTPKTRSAEAELARANAKADKALVSGSDLKTARALDEQSFKSASRAMDTRERTRAAAAKASDAKGLLVREERLAQIGWERYQRGEISDSALARTQDRVQKFRDTYERHASDLVRFRDAQAKGVAAHADQIKARSDMAAARASSIERAAAIRAAGAEAVRGARNEQQKHLIALKSDLESLAKWRENLATAHAKITSERGKIVGGETARPGRGYVPYKVVEPKAPKSKAASAAGPVVGVAKPFISSHEFTGEGLRQGLVPDNTTRLIAQHMRDAYRFVNTDEYRKQALRTGSDTRLSRRDVLARIPGETQGKISKEIDVMLGRSKLTTDELAGHADAFDAFRQQLVPGLRDKFSKDNAQELGTKAPEGFKWVDRNILGDLAKPPPGPRGKVARTADAINSAVTAATVYFKVGHIGTRVLTNATTTILQGAAEPHHLEASVKLWQAIKPEDRQRALAVSGQHGYASMPHEGTGRVARIAGRGANWWAKHVDAPFRFASIAYEARKAGFDTPEKFRYMLDKLDDHGEGLNAAEWAKIDWVAKRANRAGIAYDRLNSTERRFVTRGVWFFPWVKGATLFAGHVFAEHPYKAAMLGQAGAQGRELQQREIGDVPSYAEGLFQMKGPDKTGRPLVADFSTFSPFATPADVIQAGVKPSELSGFLNPAASAATGLIFGLNQYGDKSRNSPLRDAYDTLTSPTPEAQILNAYLNRHKDQSKRMYKTTPESALVRAFVGPGVPRRLNTHAAHSAAARQRSGR